MNKESLGFSIKSRPKLTQLTHLGRGRLEKLNKMLYANGPGNGTFLSLPFDQLIEHGAAHIFKWAKEDLSEVRITGRGSADPRTVIELANIGDFSAVVLHPGIVDKYQELLNLNVPLIYKIDGHMSIPQNPHILSTIGSIKEALRLGADAIGASFYPGSEMNRVDMERIGTIVRKAHEYGLPAVLWTYPRGPGVNEVGGDSLFWVHYGVVVAESLGADIIKTKFPEPVKKEKKEAYINYVTKISKKIKSAQRYLELEPNENEELTEKQHTTRMKLVVDAVPRSFVLVSGGPQIKENTEENLAKITRIVMNAGAEGRIIGRNFWGVPINNGLKYATIVAEIMKQSKYHRPI